MERGKTLSLVFLIGITLMLSLGNNKGYAQEEETQFHELEPEDDAFQENFFLALRYKAIGNYKLALQALDAAENISDKNDEKLKAIDFERAQNHYYLREFEEAIEYFEALQKTDKTREVQSWLYQSYMQIRDYKNAKKSVVELLSYSEIYLPNFYMLYIELIPEPEKALQILERVYQDKSATRQVGFYKDLIRESLIGKSDRKTTQPEISEEAITNLQSILEQKNWKEVEMYMAILLQKESNVLPVWKQLTRTGDFPQIYQSLSLVYSTQNIPEVSKENLLSILLKEQQNTLELQKFLQNIYLHIDAKSLVKIGKYFQNENQIDIAKRMYLKSLAISFDNYSLIIETLQLLSVTADYNEQLELVENAMEYYPMQPVLYFYKGEALLGMQQWIKATEILEEGKAYIIDQPDLVEKFSKLIQSANKQQN